MIYMKSHHSIMLSCYAMIYTIIGQVYESTLRNYRSLGYQYVRIQDPCFSLICLITMDYSKLPRVIEVSLWGAFV